MLELVGGCGRLLNDKVTCTDLFAEVTSLLRCQSLAFGSFWWGIWERACGCFFERTQM